MAVSEQFYVDQFHVGSVIGKNGATINKIKVGVVAVSGDGRGD
jgi:predicted RNA-binding protein YlqC (UPF0109 family)